MVRFQSDAANQGFAVVNRQAVLTDPARAVTLDGIVGAPVPLRWRVELPAIDNGRQLPLSNVEEQIGRTRRGWRLTRCLLRPIAENQAVFLVLADEGRLGERLAGAAQVLRFDRLV